MTLWEIDVLPAAGESDVAAINLASAARDLGLSRELTIAAAHGYLLQGELSDAHAQRAAAELLADAVIEQATIARVGQPQLSAPRGQLDQLVHVLPKPGVMDPVAQSTLQALQDMGLPVEQVTTFRKYWLSGVQPAELNQLCQKLLSNDSIERVIVGPLKLDKIDVGQEYQFKLVHTPIRELNDEQLALLSRQGQLYLTLTEMQTIQQYFRTLGRDPTDIELETVAQTWSEHCSHKTLAGRIAYSDEQGQRKFKNMLKETIFQATQTIRAELGDDDWCVSVFSDNAGIVKFDDDYHVVFKVETHNHPSAIEPYGGANTGIGGVIRDTMGTGLGAKPFCSTDIFCFAPPDTDANTLPPGVLHPRRVINGVVAGVRDYGNRMGIPTVNGAVYFDPRYLGNPLVYCGNAGLLPVDRVTKQPLAGDWIVSIGGRTGRDGIHGATFSSAELTSESESISGGSVQIGNAITPLKYEGLSYTEIWISEAQERMVFAVPPDKLERMQAVCAAEGVEASVIGQFVPTGQLRLMYAGEQVGLLSMEFLHDGRPPVVRDATYAPPPLADTPTPQLDRAGVEDAVLRILGSLNVASKHWIIRQYDHEVQGGSAIKPLVGPACSGPGDAAVVRPRLDSRRGVVISCGMNPGYGDLDTYHMAASAIDEAVRNAVAVGADPNRLAILDNFCWGNTDRPETLGSLGRAALAWHDVAVAWKTPFISGKDSLNNEFTWIDPAGERQTIVIPPSLLISAMGQVADVAKCVTMDLKEAGNPLYLVGSTHRELGGSHLFSVLGLNGGAVPQVRLSTAKTIFEKVHAAINSGLVRSCHDLSEGGLAVAAAEMSFAGQLGLEVDVAKALQTSGLTAVEFLFAESNSRFLVEVDASCQSEWDTLMAEVAHAHIGQVSEGARVIVRDGQDVWIDKLWSELFDAWHKPLDW